MGKSVLGPIAEFRNVVKTYEEAEVGVTALNSISLSIPRNVFCMLVGASGSGKTTLLNLLGCIDRPTSGAISVCGTDIGTLADHQLTRFRAMKIGFIFQSFNLYPVLSAYENVEYPLLLMGLGAQERRERTLEMLAAVGLTDRRNHRPNQLSGGEKQRVAIARALVKSPEVVLADEPTANLDSRTGETIVELMRRMQHEQAVSFVFSTHDPALMSHAEQTFTIRDGQLVSTHGAPA